ncbi:response regulator transcription factor [Streptomyces sp. NBC_00414]|uniref:response regulator transcription factor n=1 Tax=Streptomyces sp. NBC_00414 TaxID=2975739 RepID=UPI002E1CAB30
MGVRVLLIEDDETIAEPLAEGLGHFGLTVDHVSNGADGLRGPYGDVVLLDLGLPDMDGIDVCRGIRQVSDVPIIILSARGEEADRVLGLELGADDYLAKPFSLRELVARVRAVTRRTQLGRGGTGSFTTSPSDPSGPSGPRPDTGEPYVSRPPSEPFASRAPSESYGSRAPAEPFRGESFTGASFTGESFSSGRNTVPHFEPVPLLDPDEDPDAATDSTGAGAAGGPPPGPLVVDRRTRQVWVGESSVSLTPKEFELLALLTEDPGAVYSRQQILDRVWDPHYQGPTKTLDVHVATLRRKLGDSAWIQTLRGVGFRLAVRTQPPAAYSAPSYPAPGRPAAYR